MSYADGPILFLTLTLAMRAGILTLGFLVGFLIAEALIFYKTGSL
jgi:hypothetical protein